MTSSTMHNPHKLLSLIGIGSLISASLSQAATIMPMGNTVTGTTTNITLTAGNINVNPNGNTALSNSGGNLVVDLVDTGTNSDFYLTWIGAVDGLGFSTATYSYVQIDILSTSAGLTNSQWQLFFQDDDSTIGGTTNSGQNIGLVNPQVATPFSIVIDLTEGGTMTTGAQGWGPGTLDSFRLDPFQSTANFGESFTISAITFGSNVIPEPSTSALAALGLGILITRRRRN